MAVIKLYPTSTTDVSSVISTGNHLDIDETSDTVGGDGNFVTTNTNEQTATFSFGLLNMPATDAVNSATLRVRARIANVPGSNIDLNTWTVSATTDGASVSFDQTDTSEVEYTSNLTSPTESSLNSETITVDQTNWSQTKGPDGQAFEIEFIEIEVDYDPSTATGPNLLTVLGVG